MHSPRPSWRASHREGDEFVYIHNSGYWVEDVVVRADPAKFVFADGASEGFIKGKLGDNAPGGSSGKQVAGHVTREGERSGVTIELSWTDQYGDSQPATGGPLLPHIASLPPKSPRPVTQPAWQIGRPKGGASPEVLILVNGADGFVGTNVVIEADPDYFTFVLKRELGDLAGIGGLRFAGLPTDAGRALGVDFNVTYYDINGDEHRDHVPVKFDYGLSL